MPEFTFKSGGELTGVVTGKTIDRVETPEDNYIDDYLIFYFRDGTSLHIKYDYLYEWELKRGEVVNVG